MLSVNSAGNWAFLRKGWPISWSEFATVNRWEDGKTKPSKLARRQLDHLCKEKNIAPSMNPLRRKHSS